MFIAFSAGSPAWLHQVHAHWTRLGVTPLQPNPNTLLYRPPEGTPYTARCGLIQTHTSSPALLYAHDGRYPKALHTALARALAQGQTTHTITNLGAYSVLEWSPLHAQIMARRDLLGIIPLWYVLAPKGAAEGIAFASHPKALRALLPSPSGVNVKRLAAFLTGIDTSESEDFFSGLFRLKAGECLRWRMGEGLCTTSSDTLEAEPSCDMDQQRWAQRLRQALLDGHTRTESPTIIALSGGIDSGLVAATQLRARRPAGVQAVSMVSRLWDDVDESGALDQWEAYAPIRVHRWSLDAHGPLSDLELLEAQQDLGPQGHGGVISMAGLAREAKGIVGEGVVLTGLGGDQLLECFDDEWLLSALLSGNWEALRAVRAERGLRPFYDAWVRPMLGGRLLRALRAGLGRRILARRMGYLVSSPWRDASHWLTPTARHATTPLPNIPRGRFAWTQGWVWEDAMRHLMLCEHGSGISFAHPLLDGSVLEVLTRVPPALFMHPQPKALARLALAGWMPEPLRLQPKTGCFSSLIEHHLAAHATTTIPTLFHDSHLQALGLIDSKKFMDVVQQFTTWVHTRNTPRTGCAPLWRTISAELWLRFIASS